jgi:D-amino-acid dehydrogenase
MKIAVIGAGIVGIASAYELLHDGHEVVVFDSNSTAAESASFANTGVVAPSLMQPLTHPNWPSKSWLDKVGRVSPLQVSKTPSLAELNFIWRWSSGQTSIEICEKMRSASQLIALSQSQLNQIRSAQSVDLEQSNGLLAVFRSEKQFQKLSEKLATLKALGVPYSLLSQSDISNIEPALSSDVLFSNAVHFPNDQVVNCRQLALVLKNRAQLLGATFKFNSKVSTIETAPKLAITVENDPNLHAFDQVVIATGSLSTELTSRLKITLPMLPVGSYSLSATVKEPLDAPSSAVLDTSTATMITRMGKRVRVSCGAELGGPSKFNSTATQLLFSSLQRFFPGSVNYSMATQLWKSSYGLMTDGMPAIGRSSTPGIWLNVGHGANGWGMALGSARLLADMLSEHTPSLDPKHFDPTRFSKK